MLGCLSSLPVLGPALLWVQGAARWSWQSVCLSVFLPILLSHLTYPLQGSHSPGCREGTWIIPCPIPCNPAGVGLAPVKSHGWVLRIPTVPIPPVSAALSL